MPKVIIKSTALAKNKKDVLKARVAVRSLHTAEVNSMFTFGKVLVKRLANSIIIF